MINDFDLRKIVTPLEAWFEKNARILPWREQPSAYYVWVSEIMLQQTRVEAVKPYFDRFIKALPDVKALAECPEDKLLKLWEGLGYYNRVRNLKAAAIQIMEEYNGEIPSDYEELLKLKGIGPYTAGAISSIAYGKSVPAVDGNVLRVISRVTADSGDITKQSVRTNMETQLLQVMNNVELNPSVFNQALMELGAIICVPNGAPHCKECPWHDICEARKQDLIDQIPVKTKGKKRRIEEKTVLILKDGEQVALHKRASKGLLAGLYELPNMDGHFTEKEVVAFLAEKGYKPIRIQSACDAKHIFSHVEWHMKGYVVFLQAGDFEEKVKDDWFFIDVEDTKDTYAIPSAFVKYTEYLNMVIGKDAIE